MKILIIGLTSTALGGMEYGNLGNYAIMEPFIEQLKFFFPSAQIKTSIQMSDSFCKKLDIKSLRNKRFWSYGYYTASRTLADIFKVVLCKILAIFKINASFLLKSSMLLRELYEADLVIDFSGDIYGENASWNRFLESNARLFFCRLLKKKTAMLIGSPGPFQTIWRQAIAKKTLKKIDLLTNREPISTMLLEYIGIKGNHIVTTACPSVLFEPEDSAFIRQSIEKEQLKTDGKPTVGLIICGWNMPKAPYNKWPRENAEYLNFIALIKHLIDDLGLRVCLMSHQNAVDQNFNLIKGNDHRIIDQLMSLLESDYGTDSLFTLKGLYTAAQSKSIIANFDILISGRIHGAVQGLSQFIPTMIIDYGHEPKAHKLRGFAKIYGVEDYICNPAEKENMIKVVDSLWEQRDSIRKHLSDRVPVVKAAAIKNFTLLQDIVENRM